MKPPHRERNLVLIFCGAMLVSIVAASFLAAPNDDSDKSPTTYNRGTAGIKVAYLLLGELGYSTARWEQPPSALANIDPAQTAIIFAEPNVPADKLGEFRSDLDAFLERGGRVIVTGQQGAGLLPDGQAGNPTLPFGNLCLTTPEGRGPLARAGEVSIADTARWTALTPSVHVEQWCGSDAVVVSYRVGSGTAIWWSSALPLTNGGLRDDASLKLLLASVGDTGTANRKVFFDEYFHGAQTSLYDLTHGLPIVQIAWQIGAVAVLLVLSFGRRNGPIRPLVRLPRTSPIEFAESMGQLYRKAGATQAATEGARNRLLHFLRDRCGIPREALGSDAATIAEMLNSRFPGDWSGLGQHLEQAAEARYQSLAPRSALSLVKALDHDLKALNQHLNKPQNS
jgi:hypothetical protein